MKSKLKEIVLGGLFIGTIGLGFFGNSIQNYELVKRAIYRGYHVEKSDGEVFDVFYKPTKRDPYSEGKKYVLERTKDFKLKIHENYDIVVGKPRFSFIFPKRLINAKKPDSSHTKF